MTEREILLWYKTNLSTYIDKAIEDSGTDIYTQDWLAAMAMRETWILIPKNVNKPFEEICKLMKGDYGQRKGETKPQYHGYGFWQMDTSSFPDFIKSGDWQDPYKTCMKAISILQAKRKVVGRFEISLFFEYIKSNYKLHHYFADLLVRKMQNVFQGLYLPFA